MITIPNKLGLLDYLRNQGWALRQREEGWFARNSDGIEDDAAIQLLIDAYDELPELRRIKINQIKQEGLALIQQIFPAISDLDELKLVVNILQSITAAARSPTPEITTLQSIWQAAQTARQAVRDAMTAEAIAAVVPVWPTLP